MYIYILTLSTLGISWECVVHLKSSLLSYKCIVATTKRMLILNILITDSVIWCCGYSKCNEPERCPYCSDSPLDNSTFSCPEKSDSGEGISQTGNYDICTKSSKCISVCILFYNKYILYLV